jgi:DNA-directed RNA polymerase delta subunit
MDNNDVPLNKPPPFNLQNAGHEPDSGGRTLSGFSKENPESCEANARPCGLKVKKTAEESRREIDHLSLEFLINKKLYKKIIGNNSSCPQTLRENEERKQYMVKYKTRILELFTKLLNDGDNVTISQEIRGIFDSFIDKSVNYFIRTQQMLQPTNNNNKHHNKRHNKYDDDDDVDDEDDENNEEQYEDEDDKDYDDNDGTNNDGTNNDGTNNDGTNNDGTNNDGKISSNWGDDIILSNK